MGAYEVEGGFSEWIKEGGNVQALGAADHLQMEQGKSSAAVPPERSLASTPTSLIPLSPLEYLLQSI